MFELSEPWEDDELDTGGSFDCDARSGRVVCQWVDTFHDLTRSVRTQDMPAPPFAGVRETRKDSR